MFRIIKWLLAMLVFAITAYELYHPMLIATNRPDHYWRNYWGVMIPALITLAIVLYKVRQRRDWITISALAAGIACIVFTAPLLYIFSGKARFYRGEHSTNSNDYNAWYFESGYYYIEYSEFIAVDSVCYGRWENKDGHIQLTELTPHSGRRDVLCRPALDRVITDPDGHDQYEFRFAHPADTVLVGICP